MAKIFGNWEIGECIGEGAYGKVYKITKEDFGEVYNAALKVIEIPANQSEVESVRNEGLDDKSVTDYFNSIVKDVVAEISLMSKLKGNSNIVSYEDHSVVPNENKFGYTIYIRMELLTPLYTYIKENPLTVRDVIKLGIDMCLALEVCQKYNIIHRDIKPENIFISDIGDFKLGDFGIARQLEKTSSGLSQKGTYSYMAPEVYKGLEYNSTVDLYSLGIVLYRFMNGNRLPFMPLPPEPIKYSDKEKANYLRMGGQILPKPCNAEGRLAEIILKACSYNPKERYESAFDMHQALQNVLYSKHEGEIIYPDGDALANTNNEYLTDSNIYKRRQIEDIFVNDKSLKNDISKDKFVVHESDKSYEDNLYESNKDLYDSTLYVNTDIDGIASNITGEAETFYNNIEEHDFSENQIGSSKLEDSSLLNSTNYNIYTDGSKRNFLFRALAGLFFVSAISMAILLIVVLKSDSNEGTSYNNKTVSKTNISDEDNYDNKKTNNNGGIKENKPKETKEPKVILIPDLKNLSKSDALKSLKENSLNYKIEEKYSDKIKKGMVISQSPKSGIETETGTDINIVISKGIEKVKVPSVTGMSLEKAKSKLKNNSLGYKVKKEYSSKISKGKVIRQSTKKGTKVKKNKVITLVVSKGKKPKQVIQTPTPSFDSNDTGSSDYSGNSGAGNSSTGSSDSKNSGESKSGSSGESKKPENKKPSKGGGSKNDWVVEWN